MSRKNSHKSEETQFSSSRLRNVIDEMFDGKWTVFAKTIGCYDATVKNWLDGKAEPKRSNLLKIIKHTGKSEEYYYPEPVEYEQDPEQIRPRTAPVTESGSNGLPDLGAHKVVNVFEADTEYFIEAVREVLGSGEAGIINALKSNIIQFKEPVRDKRRIEALEKAFSRIEDPGIRRDIFESNDTTKKKTTSKI